MKTHNPIMMVMLACLLMLSSACGKKSMRGVSGGEELFSSESNHGVTGHDQALYDDSLVQFEETPLVDGVEAWADGTGATMGTGGEKNHEGNASGDSSAQFEGTPSADGSDAATIEALSAADLGDGKGGTGLAGSGPEGSASVFPASTRSGAPGSFEGAFETTRNKAMAKALTRDQLTAFGLSSDVSASHESARRNDAQISKALRDVFFAYDSWRLSEQSHRILESNAEWLKAHPHARITIEGHCDERGTQAYNYVLGERRAETAKRYLSHLGIPSYQMVVVSYGKDQPACHVFSAACFKSNRRAHFSIDVNTASRD